VGQPRPSCNSIAALIFRSGRRGSGNDRAAAESSPDMSWPPPTLRRSPQEPTATTPGWARSLGAWSNKLVDDYHLTKPHMPDKTVSAREDWNQ
jgi:hypothetical protein